MQTDKFNQEEFRVRANGICSDLARKLCGTAIRKGVFDGSAVVRQVHEEFQGIFNQAIGRRKYAILRYEEEFLFGKMEREVWPEISAKLNDIIFEFASKKKVRDINKTTAEAVIAAYLSEAGIDGFSVVGQCYRAKVTVVTPSKYRMMFIVKYKDIADGKMESILAQFKALSQSVEALPFQVKIWK